MNSKAFKLLKLFPNSIVQVTSGQFRGRRGCVEKTEKDTHAFVRFMDRWGFGMWFHGDFLDLDMARGDAMDLERIEELKKRAERVTVLTQIIERLQGPNPFERSETNWGNKPCVMTDALVDEILEEGRKIVLLKRESELLEILGGK